LCGAGIGNLATLKRFVDLLFIYLNILWCDSSVIMLHKTINSQHWIVVQYYY
jgi:hypothetical protein